METSKCCFKRRRPDEDDQTDVAMISKCLDTFKVMPLLNKQRQYNFHEGEQEGIYDYDEPYYGRTNYRFKKLKGLVDFVTADLENCSTSKNVYIVRDMNKTVKTDCIFSFQFRASTVSKVRFSIGSVNISNCFPKKIANNVFSNKSTNDLYSFDFSDHIKGFDCLIFDCVKYIMPELRIYGTDIREVKVLGGVFKDNKVMRYFCDEEDMNDDPVDVQCVRYYEKHNDVPIDVLYETQYDKYVGIMNENSNGEIYIDCDDKTIYHPDVFNNSWNVVKNMRIDFDREVFFNNIRIEAFYEGKYRLITTVNREDLKRIPGTSNTYVFENNYHDKMFLFNRVRLVFDENIEAHFSICFTNFNMFRMRYGVTGAIYCGWGLKVYTKSSRLNDTHTQYLHMKNTNSGEGTVMAYFSKPDIETKYQPDHPWYNVVLKPFLKET